MTPSCSSLFIFRHIFRCSILYGVRMQPKLVRNMLKIFLDLQRISIIKLVGEFRTVSAAFSKLRTLCLLLFCTLFCGQRQQRTRTTMLAAAAVLRPLSTLSLSTTLFFNYFSPSALQESRVKCRAVRQGRRTLSREGSGMRDH